MSEAADLLSWYDKHRRDLPWRRTSDPYQIWVSEIMLQQTRVETALPYFAAFIERFPTLEALAAASIDDVLARWSGLGYYRRARQMHAAAQILSQEGRGMPTSAGQLLELPGIGPYTSAAIASIAFGEVIPVLDGNVERVMARWLACAEDPKRSSGRALLSSAAASLLDGERPGDSNQALMELGATLCRPRNPQCLLCPLMDTCKGRQEAEKYPLQRPRRQQERVKKVAAVIQQAGRALFFRRPEDAELMAGLWELPWVPAGDDQEIEAALVARYGGEWSLGASHGSVRHSITHRALTIEVRSAKFEAGKNVAEGPEAAWISGEQQADYGISSMARKILRKIM